MLSYCRREKQGTKPLTNHLPPLLDTGSTRPYPDRASQRDIGQLGHRCLDLVHRIFVVMEFVVQVSGIGGHIEVTMTA